MSSWSLFDLWHYALMLSLLCFGYGSHDARILSGPVSMAFPTNGIIV